MFLPFENTGLLTLQCQGQQFLAELCLYSIPSDAKKKATNAAALNKSQRTSKPKHWDQGKEKSPTV